MRSLEGLGLQPTGRLQQLNSYENRVYDVWLEGGDRAILKVYRPDRWSREAIQEEHQFLEDLHAEGLPTSRAIPFSGETLLSAEGLNFSIFERISGRSPDELTSQGAEAVGRRLALLHSVGARRPAEHRPLLTVEGYGEPALDALVQYLGARASLEIFGSGRRASGFNRRQNRPVRFHSHPRRLPSG